MLSGLPVASLPEAPLNRYFDVPEGILPEATVEYYQDPVLKASARPDPCTSAFGSGIWQGGWGWVRVGGAAGGRHSRRQPGS